MLEFLPYNVKEALRFINIAEVCEIRLRGNQPTTVYYRGEYQYLGLYGITSNCRNAIYPTFDDIEECVYRAGNCSIYAVEEQLRKGFITASNGERVGIAGEYVFENGKPHAIRKFSSICIRVPHAVIDCGGEIYRKCMSEGICNLLIMSPPGQGKTTILRDLARILSDRTHKNILICDERAEIAIENSNIRCDVLRYADKTTAFDIGIRALRPNIIITDELSLEDVTAVKRAIAAGVNVIASAHYKNFNVMSDVFLGVFDYYAVLDEIKIGALKEIFNNNGQVVV